MPVDKFGRRDDKQTRGSVNLNDTFLRRDGTNTVIGTINMTGNNLTNLSSPENDHDAANKVYVDENLGISKTGDVMIGDLILSAEGNNDRVLGCTNLDLERSFTIPLGTRTNRLYFVFRRNPVVMDTDFGFMVKARNEIVCRLGTTYNPSEIVIYKNVRMNLNRITNLPEPSLAHEVANKLYVDRTPRKILQGYIPSLMTKSVAISNDKFGFLVTASSYLSNHYRPENAVNGLFSSGSGSRGEWATNGETRNFWLQVKCPDPVRIWKITLRGRDTNTQRIYRWQLEASNDGERFTILLNPPNPTYIANEVLDFPIENPNRFIYFRLYCIEAEPTNPGLSYMQLYVYSE